MANKPINKQYLVQSFKDFENYAFYEVVSEKQKVIDTPESYEVTLDSTNPLAIEVKAENFAEISALLPTVEIGDFVLHTNEVSHEEDVNVKKLVYRRRDDSYSKDETNELITNSALSEYKPNTQYAAGFCVIYDNKIYKAKVSNKDSSFVDDKWQMIGGASIFNIVTTLPSDTSAYKEDQLFYLKNDEVDNVTDPSNPVTVHSKGFWIFDSTAKTYTQYRAFANIDLDFSEIFDDSATSTNKGNANDVVSSKYLYEQIKSVSETIMDEINDIYDIAGNPSYIVLESKAALEAYDLDTLSDNSIGIFMVVSDESQPIPDTNPVENYSTIYVSVADDDSKTRTVKYAGKLNYGEIAIKDIISKAIHEALFEDISKPAYYKKVTSSTQGALVVVQDGEEHDSETQIEESMVTPIEDGVEISVGDYVKFIPSETIVITKYLKANEFETEVINFASDDYQNLTPTTTP